VHFPATHADDAGGGWGHGAQLAGSGPGRVPVPVVPVDRPNAGWPPFVFGGGVFVGVGGGGGRACSTGTATFVGQHPHGAA